MTESNPLIQLLRDCVVRIDRGDQFSGTGFFVAPGEVLTCTHVIEGNAPITVSKGDWRSPAEIVDSAPKLEDGSSGSSFPLPDIALLRVHDVPSSHPSVLMDPEVPVTGAEADLLRVSAFSLKVHQPGVVEQHGSMVEFEDAFGELGMFKLRDGQVEPGFSGAPLLNTRTGRVCGLVESFRGESGERGGFAVPISIVGEEFKGLFERNRTPDVESAWDEALSEERVAAAKRRGEAERLPLLPPPYELDPDADYAPSELLKPRHGVVDLLEREELQVSLMRWRESGDRLGVLIVTGAGGTGKTRLALEECAGAERAGWMAGLFAQDGAADPDAELARLVEWPGRLFLAIDYAETRPGLVAALIKRLSRRGDGPPARLVLICRQADHVGELEDLFATGDDRETVAVALRLAERVALGEPEYRLDSRRLFEAGVASFAARLGKGEAKAAPETSLKGGHFDRPLFVLAAALLSVTDPTIDVDALGRDELMLELIDRHESQYWERWNESLGVGLDKSLRSRAVAAATMLGADGEEEALELVGAIPGLGEAGPERRREIARWLSHLYSGGELDRSPSIAPVEPDMLGEALVGRECIGRPDLIDAALDAASDTQLARALMVLARACAGEEQLEGHLGRSLGERLPALVRRAAESTSRSELALALELAVLGSQPKAKAVEAAREARRAGAAMASLAAAIYGVAIDDLRRDDLGSAEPAFRNDFAGLLTDFSNALADSYRGKEALPAIEEATKIRERLVEQGHEEYELPLANARNELAVQLLARGQSKEALAQLRNAVDTYRALTKDCRRRYLPFLSGSLANLSEALHARGQDDKALLAIEEAVEGYREFAEDEPERHLPDFVAALQSKADALPEGRWQREAPLLLEEAADRSRELFELNPGRHTPLRATSLSRLALCLLIVGNGESVRTMTEEAVALLRRLVDEGVTFYLPQLVESLNALTVVLAKETEEVATVAEEAVRRSRDLVELDPESHLENLAVALMNLSKALHNLGRADKALVEIERDLARARDRGDAGLILLCRAEWHQDEGDTGAAIEDALLAIDSGKKTGDDGLRKEARACLSKLRAADRAGFDASWKQTVGKGLPTWLRDRSAEKKRWAKRFEADEKPTPRDLETLQGWLKCSVDELQKYLEENTDHLFKAGVEKVLRETALKFPEHPVVFSRLGLLELARMDGLAAAFEESTGFMSPEDGDYLYAAEDPRALAIARLYSGFSKHPDIQFHHAIAAAVAGQRTEAAQAIERCRQRMQTDERDEYLARLDAFHSPGASYSTPLKRLRKALCEPLPEVGAG